MDTNGAIAPRLQRDVMLFSFAWLVTANLVGLLLSLLLLFPELGRLIAPVSYGRLMPLHMEWQLYGWCSLPLVGLLLREFVRKGSDAVANERFALTAWSAGLLVGGVGFLTGHASGKLFLSWSGFSRTFFPIALLLVWSVLATHWIRNLRDPHINKARKLVQAGLLVILSMVPFALYFSASKSVYPPVNPESGGATGHSLLASTLGLLGMFAAVPMLLGRGRRPSRIFPLFWAAYGLLWVLYWSIHHGNASNREWNQIIGLGGLLPVVPLLWAYLKVWDWPEGSRSWVNAFLLWWALLTLNGWVTFLPGLLDRLKFTNALVAHAHLAMAGMVTAFIFIIFASLGPDSGNSRKQPLGGRTGFLVWNGACLFMTVILFIQGWREGGDYGTIFGHDKVTTVDYLIRTLAGAAMLAVSVWWLWKSFSERRTS